MVETLQVLVERIRNPDKNTRSAAVIALGNLGLPALDALLSTVGTEPDFYIREDITWALVRLGEAAFAPLVGLLGHIDPAVRHHAAHTLGKIGDRRATDALIAALDDAEPVVISKVAFTLSLFQDEKAVSGLVRLLGHSDPEVQATVVTALEQFGVSALPAVTAAMADPNPQVRELAADVLGAIGDAGTVPVLVEALHDSHWTVRFAAATSLSLTGGPRAKEALLALRDDPDKRVRQLAAQLTKRMKG